MDNIATEKDEILMINQENIRLLETIGFKNRTFSITHYVITHDKDPRVKLKYLFSNGNVQTCGLKFEISGILTPELALKIQEQIEQGAVVL